MSSLRVSMHDATFKQIEKDQGRKVNMRGNHPGLPDPPLPPPLSFSLSLVCVCLPPLVCSRAHVRVFAC